DHVAASLVLDEAWVLGASYTLSYENGVGITHTPEVDATLLPDLHWAATLSADGTPPADSQFPACRIVLGVRVCTPVVWLLWSVGGTALASYASTGSSNFEWGADASYGLHNYNLKYTIEAGLLVGRQATDELWQHRMGLGVNGQVFRRVDIDLRGA